MPACLYAVGLERAALPAAVAAKAGYPAVEVQVRVAGRGQLERMGNGVQHLFRVSERRCRHAVLGNEHYAAARSPGEGTPAHLLVVAHVLRFAVRHELVFYGAFVQPYELRCLAVVVIVYRAAAVVSVFGVLCRHLQQVA